MKKATAKAAARARGKGRATRQRVIEQAAPVLNTKGFAGTAMSDLMAATGLKKGGIYRHFASKEELALESLRYTLAAAERTKFEGIDASAEGIDQLKAFIRNFVERRSPVPGGCPVLNTSVDQDDGILAMRKAAECTVLAWRKKLADMVRKSQRSGKMTRRTSADAVALMILSTLEGALAIHRLAPTAHAMDTAQVFLEQWIDGLST
jgi:AcrR family transcriptional regulator